MSEQIRQALDENIPSDAVEQRSGGGGKQLSYLTGHYVIDRLNKVLGHENWSKEIVKFQQLPGDGKPSYMAIVRILAKIGNNTVIKDGVGYGSDKSDHNAHELAMKEAVTDATKTAAKDLGISMGLGLYFKSGDYVADDKPAKVATQSTKQLASGSSSQGNAALAGATGVKTITAEVDPRATIKSALNVLTAQKKITKSEFIQKYLNGKTEYSALSDTEAYNAVVLVNKDFKELKLI